MSQRTYLTAAERFYPGVDWSQYAPCASYAPIIHGLGYPLVISSDHDYSGDTFVLYTRPDCTYGILVIGWGSCAGCDALQGCASYDDLNALIDDLERSIVWLPDLAAAREWVSSPHRKGSHYHYSEAWPAFQQAVCNYGKLPPN